jgi:hypothetical protein
MAKNEEGRVEALVSELDLDTGYGYEIDWIALYIHLYMNAWF